MWHQLLLVLIVGVTAEEGPQLWHLSVSSHHPVIHRLANDAQLDVWGSGGDHAKVLVERSAEKIVSRTLREADISHHVENHDVFTLIEEEQKHMERRRKKRQASAPNQMDWSSYHKLQDIEGFIGWLNATYSDIVTVSSAALTKERRHIYIVRINDPSQPGPKKKIWIEGGIHAREWISPAVTTYLLHQVTTNPKWKPILAKTEWFIVPVANPDGYHHSFTSNRARLWRKNRNDNGGAECKGVDLNRNWNIKWGVGASKNPCSETFMGTHAFSEEETRGLGLIMEAVQPIDLFITFHSYGQAVLYPWGWTYKPPPNAKSLDNLAHIFADTVIRYSNGRTNYDIGGSGPKYGLASGATDDWAYGFLGSPFSYTIELPDTGSYGFLLPENQIGDTVVETAMGMYCMVGTLSDTDDCRQQTPNQPSHLNNHLPNRQGQGINFGS